MVYYHSTRDKNRRVTPSRAIIQGISEDGGLFVRDEFPQLKLHDILGKSMMELSQLVLSSLLEDFTQEEAAKCVQKAYGSTFYHEDITPLHILDNDYILELFHGPTCAFKDVGLQMLPQLIHTSLQKCKEDKKILILTATSGDTGKAALEGFKDVEDCSIMVFYPHDGTSEIQRLQMVCQEGRNVGVCAINGNFDDAQNAVKEIFTDAFIHEQAKQKNIQISSANSINIARLIPQIVYYIYAYAQMVKHKQIEAGEAICFSVPTGNFGDLLAGYYAKKMGLPIHKFICAVNANNVLYDFFQTGTYNRNRPFHKTLSPSMDILISSNLERLLYEVSNHDTKRIAHYMKELQDHGSYTISDDMKQALDTLIFPSCSSDEDIKETIHTMYQTKHYVMDPHTAVAYKGTCDYRDIDPKHKIVTLSTASPFKFANHVYPSIFNETDVNEQEAMKYLSAQCQLDIPYPLKDLDKKTIRYHDCIDKQDIKSYVEAFMKEMK